MKIHTTPFINSIQQIKTSGQYPNDLTIWAKDTAKRHYVESFTYLDEILTHLDSLEDEVDVLSIFPKWTDENNAYWGTCVTLVTYLLKALPIQLPTKEVLIEGNYSINQPTLIEGDLVINGDLNIGYIEDHAIGLVVLGDLTIKGNYPLEDGLLVVFGNVTIEGYLDERSDWSITTIGGNLTVHQYLASSGELFVYGQTISPFIYLSYNHGFAILKDGFTSLYFHEADHGGSLCFGSYQAKFIRVDEMLGVKALDSSNNYKNLQEIINAALLGELATVDLENYDKEQYYDVEEYLEEELEFDPFELSDNFLAAFQENQPVFKSTILEQWKNNLI